LPSVFRPNRYTNLSACVRFADVRAGTRLRAAVPVLPLVAALAALPAVPALAVVAALPALPVLPVVVFAI
jgi:hypothetical protein